MVHMFCICTLVLKAPTWIKEYCAECRFFNLKIDKARRWVNVFGRENSGKKEF